MPYLNCYGRFSKQLYFHVKCFLPSIDTESKPFQRNRQIKLPLQRNKIDES